MQIKTIAIRLDNAVEFDELVNEALDDGWTLTKRRVLSNGQPNTDDVYFKTMLYAELQKGETTDESLPTVREENNALRARLQHLLESETVRMFDQKDPVTRLYVRDIRRLDTYGVQYKLREHERDMG